MFVSFCSRDRLDSFVWHYEKSVLVAVLGLSRRMANTKEGNFGGAEIVGNKAVKRKRIDMRFFGKNTLMENRPTRKSDSG